MEWGFDRTRIRQWAGEQEATLACIVAPVGYTCAAVYSVRAHVWLVEVRSLPIAHLMGYLYAPL